MMQRLGKTRVTYKPKRRTIPLYSAAWARLRAEVLADEPLCRHCKAIGLVTPATEVDHIEDSRADYSDDNSRENLQGLCRTCHSIKTRAEMQATPGGEGGMPIKPRKKGCDKNGFPLDPEHNWNSGNITSN